MLIGGQEQLVLPNGQTAAAESADLSAIGGEAVAFRQWIEDDRADLDHVDTVNGCRFYRDGTFYNPVISGGHVYCDGGGFTTKASGDSVTYYSLDRTSTIASITVPDDMVVH